MPFITTSTLVPKFSNVTLAAFGTFNLTDPKGASGEVVLIRMGLCYLSHNYR